MDADEAHAIGFALWRVRDARRKSLRVVAELAGMSKDTLNRIETGERSPTLVEVGLLAEALEIPSAELTRLPVPAPGNGHSDSAIGAVRLALMAVSRKRPGGQVTPVEALRTRVHAAQDALHQCRKAELSAMLPGLIRDVHTSCVVAATV